MRPTAERTAGLTPPYYSQPRGCTRVTLLESLPPSLATGKDAEGQGASQPGTWFLEALLET